MPEIKKKEVKHEKPAAKEVKLKSKMVGIREPLEKAHEKKGGIKPLAKGGKGSKVGVGTAGSDLKSMVKRILLEQYTVTADNISITIRITGGPGLSPRYEIIYPSFSPATQALLDDIKIKLITDVKVSTREILDPKTIASLKKRFYSKTETLLAPKLPTMPKEQKANLIATLIHDMLGLGKIEFLLNDTFLEEIVVTSSKEPLRVYHKKYGWLETNIVLETEEQILNYSNIIARRVGRQITTLTPLLDAHLVTGDRVNAVLYPISNKGNTITIRKFARDPWTVTDFISNKTVSSQLMAVIWLSMQYEMNILVSGGTASGKTSFLNIIMPFIPSNQRIISIEDTRELTLPKFLYWCPLTTRLPNPEGRGEITMLDLLVNSLRMRPDRIILGEMRRKAEAEVMFEAMHTGHSVYATVHADSLNETVRRLINPPIEVPKNLLSAVNLNAVMFRDRRSGRRRIFQTGEFIVSDKGDVRTNLVYRWDPISDKIIEHSKPVRLFEDLGRFTGLNQNEINADIKEKSNILDYLVKYNIRDVESVGRIMREYYLDKETILKMIKTPPK